MRNLLLIIFSILLLAACTNSALRTQHSQLAKADSLMHTHPDSALALLQSISADSLTDEANRAYHALLLSQALDKNYIDKTDDSLINIAVAYYADKAISTQQMLAHYYHARIKQNAKAYPEALYSALHAEAAALQLNDHYHLGLIYRLIMECYKRGYNEKKALEYAQLSYEHFALTEYKRYTNFALLNLADAYTANRNINQSIGIISPLIEVAEADKDTSLLSNALSSYSNTLMLQKKYALAKTALLRLQMIKERPLTTRNYSHLAICYLYENQPDSALYYGVKAEKMIKNDADRYLYEKLQYLYHRREKDFETALAAYRKASSHHDDAMSTADNHEIDAIVQQFHEEQLEMAQKRTMKHYFYVVLVIFILFGVALGYLLVARKRKIDAYLQLQKSLEQMSQQKVENKQFAGQKTKDGIKDTTIYQTLYKRLQDPKGKIFVTDEEWEEVKRTILKESPTFIERLDDIYPFSLYEKQICFLIRMDFPPSAIAKLLERPKETITSTRRRLYNRIFKEKGEPKDWDAFIRSL